MGIIFASFFNQNLITNTYLHYLLFIIHLFSGEREAEIVREKILKLQAETKNELETGGKDGCVCMFA